jgi:hypothetical protein
LDEQWFAIIPDQTCFHTEFRLPQFGNVYKVDLLPEPRGPFRLVPAHCAAFPVTLESGAGRNWRRRTISLAFFFVCGSSKGHLASFMLGNHGQRDFDNISHPANGASGSRNKIEKKAYIYIWRLTEINTIGPQKFAQSKYRQNIS